MATFYIIVAAVCVLANAAPPAQNRFYQQTSPQQQMSPLDYYIDNSDEASYYQSHQKQVNASPNGSPSRLEDLDPNTEVELIPGGEQPQQPPQQTPVVPNVPGLIPGQRVFIVHMPIPGYRPGTVGGYQPVYIVGAAPQGNTGYPGNGFQNGVLVDPGQAVVSPVLGYARPGAGYQNPLLYGGAAVPNGLYNAGYPNPFAYQALQSHAPVIASVPFQIIPQQHQSNVNNQVPVNPEPKSANQVTIDSKGSIEEDKRSKPLTQTQRNKA